MRIRSYRPGLFERIGEAIDQSIIKYRASIIAIIILLGFAAGLIVGVKTGLIPPTV